MYNVLHYSSSKSRVIVIIVVDAVVCNWNYFINSSFLTIWLHKVFTKPRNALMFHAT